jgi:hypothetical protein
MPAMLGRRCVVLLLCLLAAACVHAEHFYSSYIFISLPGKPLAEAKAELLEVLTARGDRKGGDWFIEGRRVQLPTDCPGAASYAACLQGLKPRAEWREIEEAREGEVRFWFDIFRNGSIAIEPRVIIEDRGGDSVATIDITTFATPMRRWEVEEYYALKRDLVARFGAAVTTRDEP